MSEEVVVSFLLSGFTGQRKNWWDHCLALKYKIQIDLEHKALVELSDGYIVQQSDVCDFLILTIGMHFVGNQREELISSKVDLTNIRCPTLRDHRCYKDIFLLCLEKRRLYCIFLEGKIYYKTY